MASVLLQGPNTPLSINEFASSIGRGRDTVAKLIKDAGIRPSGDPDAAHARYTFLDLCVAAFSPSNAARREDGTIDPSKLLPNEAKTYWASMKLQIEVETKQQKLVPAEKVEREYAKLVKTLVQALDTLPDTLERDASLTGVAVQKLHDIVAGVRERLAASIFSHEEVAEE